MRAKEIPLKWRGTAVEELSNKLLVLAITLSGNLSIHKRPKEAEAFAAVKRILDSADRVDETARNLVVLVYGLTRRDVNRPDTLLEDYAKEFLVENHLLIAEAAILWV